MCVMLVYGPQMGRTGAEKQDFKDALQRMMGLDEMELMLCIEVEFFFHACGSC